MREMDVDRSTVLGVLDYPEVDYVSQDRRVAKRGDLSVVYQPSNRVVITVLLNRTEQWDRTQDKVKTSA